MCIDEKNLLLSTLFANVKRSVTGQCADKCPTETGSIFCSSNYWPFQKPKAEEFYSTGLPQGRGPTVHSHQFHIIQEISIVPSMLSLLPQFFLHQSTKLQSMVVSKHGQSVSIRLFKPKLAFRLCLLSFFTSRILIKGQAL